MSAMARSANGITIFFAESSEPAQLDRGVCRFRPFRMPLSILKRYFEHVRPTTTSTRDDIDPRFPATDSSRCRIGRNNEPNSFLLKVPPQWHRHSYSLLPQRRSHDMYESLATDLIRDKPGNGYNLQKF